jgi:hypothetical protein
VKGYSVQLTQDKSSCEYSNGTSEVENIRTSEGNTFLSRDLDLSEINK